MSGIWIMFDSAYGVPSVSSHQNVSVDSPPVKSCVPMQTIAPSSVGHTASTRCTSDVEANAAPPKMGPKSASVNEGGLVVSVSCARRTCTPSASWSAVYSHVCPFASVTSPGRMQRPATVVALVDDSA